MSHVPVAAPGAAEAAAARPAQTGILLVNTGTPDTPAVADVRRYLRQFLSDPRVIDMPALARWLLLELIILPTRPRKSAEAYHKIWTPAGSPLRLHGLSLAERLQAELSDCQVRLAFQFGNPSIPSQLDALRDAGCDRLLVVPLFPHYAAASFGSTAAAVMTEAAKRWVVPSVQIAEPFWHAPEFLAAVTEAVREHLQQFAPDHILLAYHGVPERHCTRTDTTGSHCLKQPGCCDQLVAANRHCYRAQCLATSRALIEALALDPARTTTAFQSRLGRVPWVRPYADEVIPALARQGVKRLLVVEPSFVADCLETLEEIGMRGAEDFRAAGGEELQLVPSLNTRAVWVRGLAAIVRRGCAWVGPARDPSAAAAPPSD